MSSINNSTNLPSANNIISGKPVETDSKSLKSSSNSSSSTAVDTLSTEKNPATIPLPASNGKTPAPTAPNSPVVKPVQTTTKAVAPQLPVREDKAAVSKSKFDSVKNFGNKVSGGFKSGIASIGAFAGLVGSKIVAGFKYVGASIAAGYGAVKSFFQKLFLTQASCATEAQDMNKFNKNRPVLGCATEAEAKAAAEKQKAAAKAIGTSNKK